MSQDNLQHSIAIALTVDSLTSKSHADSDEASQVQELIELITGQNSGANEATRAIRKKLKYGNTDRQMRALTLLDALIEDAGPKLTHALAQESLLERLRVCCTSTFSDLAIRKKCTQLYWTWSQYASTPGLEGIARLHNESPKRKIPITQERSKLVQATAKPFTDVEEEVAQRRSTHELDPETEPETLPSGQWVPHIAPAFDRHLIIKPSDGPRWFSRKKGKEKLFDVRAGVHVISSVLRESAIASKNLQNSIQSTDRERQRISDNKVVTMHLKSCKQFRRRILAYIQQEEGDGWLGSLLYTNDELINALLLFEQLDQSIDPDSDSDEDERPASGCA